MSDEFGGIDPPSKAIHTYNKIESNPIMSTCKKCGCSHGMVVEDMTTGAIDPIDVCKDCMFFGTHVPIEKQVELHENCTDLYTQEQYQKILHYLFESYMHHIVMNGFDEQIVEVPGEWNEAYEKAYAVQNEIWDRADIDQRFVPVYLEYEPPPYSENRWRKLIEDCKKAEEEHAKHLPNKSLPMVSQDP